ncbi:YusG family protein [Peribacillus kribbensis]|uniref:YusG family protein n=1 Tax=Peribacillus kribbensis TaxID=356658 RepID=UPI000400E9F2|nr:YusG family protein [Peribacillus kribbensis]
MVLKQTQVDITEGVVGRIENGEMNLFSGEDRIGKVTHSDSGIAYALEDGYQAENDRIYQTVDVTETPDMKYTDCDQGGWC